MRSQVIEWLNRHPLLLDLLLPALTVLFGLQIIRVLVPGLTWLLGDRFGLDAIQLGSIALVIFLAAFLAGSLHRLQGSYRSVIITSGGLGLLRLLTQVGWSEPLINLILAALGTILFVLFLPIYLGRARLQSGSGIGLFALGLLIGLLFDTALYGAFSTYDLTWNSNLPALLLTLVLVLIQWILLAGQSKTSDPDNVKINGDFIPKTIAWVAVGPFLFLELVVFQNIPRMAVLTTWPLSYAFGLVLLAQLIALATVVWLLRTERRTLWPLAFLTGIILILTLALPYPQEAWQVTLMLLTGQVSLSLLMVIVFVGMNDRAVGTRFPGISIANGIGMVLLVVFLLGYYAVYQIDLPYNNTILEPVAAALIAGCSLFSSLKLRDFITVGQRVFVLPALAVALLILPIASVISGQEPKTITGNGFPVTIMTYNLHNGFNTNGYLNMEALARVIEDTDADIVALQEISRGWLISGRLDMLTWLSQRLDMPYVSGPTADPFWGNAILSRYPITEYKNYDLPPTDLVIKRGFISASIDLGGGDTLRIIATHFHHIDGDSDIRQLQSAALMDFWNGTSQTVILGDFNAEPTDPEIQIIKQANLVDIASYIEPPPVYTFHSDNPSQRIDYIWVTPDLRASEVSVILNTASDHLPVIAIIDRLLDID
jgi:endonuclease/exonuclease/phosphatase family metal-dependent hydrolase